MILGTAPSMNRAPYDDAAWTIWACQPAICYPVCKRADVVFELHDESYWGLPDVVKRLNDWGAPVLMQRETPLIPKSEKFPLEEMMQYWKAKGFAGAKYYTSTIAHMLAYALYKGGWETIAFFGVHMSADEEWQYQRQALEYWIGVANGMGIPVDIPSESSICAGRRVYGYDNDSKLLTEMRVTQAHFEKDMVRIKAELDAKVQEMYEVSGAAKVLRKMHREWS